MTLTMIVGAWLATSLVGRFSETSQKSRVRAVSLAGLATLGTVAVLIDTWKAGEARYDTWTIGHPLIGADVESLLLASGAGVVATAVLAASPRRALDRRTIARVALWTAFTQLTFFANDLILFIIAWTLAVVPWWTQAGSPTRRAGVRLLATSAVPLIAALGWAAWAGSGVEVLHFDERGVHGVVEGGVLLLVLLAAGSRLGLPPLHQWLGGLLRAHRIPDVLVLAGPLSGGYLLLRFGPALSHAFVVDQPWLEGVGLLAALYLAVVAYGQRDQLQTVGYVVMSQIALVFLALCSAEPVSVHGGLVLWVATVPSITGFLLCAAAIRSRCGDVPMARFHGLATRAPMLSALTFVFGLSTVGLPASLVFVAEDVIAQGLLVPHPWLAAGFVLVTALNAIGMLRWYGRVFLGADAKERCPDVSPRERVAFLVLAGLLLAASVAPQWALSAQASTAEHIVDLESRGRGSVGDSDSDR